MSGFPINGLALNAGGTLASIVYLPSSTVSNEIALSERISVTMSGSLDMHREPSGDIYKVSNLGNAPVVMARTVTGTLSKVANIGAVSSDWGMGVSGSISKVTNIGAVSIDVVVTSTGSLTIKKRVYLGDASSNMSFDPTGSINKVALGPAGVCTTGFSMYGTMVRGVQMVGGSTLNVFPAAALTKSMSPGSGNVVIQTVLAGMPIAIRMLSGDSSQAIVPDGSLSVGKRQTIPGSTITISQELTGLIGFRGGLIGNILKTLNPVGSLNIGKRQYMADAAVVIQVATAGTIMLKGGLKGQMTLQNTPRGDLAKGIRVAFPTSEVSTAITSSGYLRGVFHMPAVSTFGFEPTAVLSIGKSVSGSITMQRDLAGYLSNNALGSDIDTTTMIRRPINREMYR